MASEIRVDLDTNKNNYVMVECKQNDDLILYADIYENGLELDLINKEVSIQALKKDKTYIIQNTEITKVENKINSNLVRDFTRLAGTTIVEIILMESGKQNSTFSFYLKVVESVIDGAVKSGDSITALEKVQNAASEIRQISKETQELLEKAGAVSKEELNIVNTELTEVKSYLENTPVKEDLNKVNKELADVKDYLNYMPVNGGTFENFDGSENNNVMIDGGIY